MIGGTSEELHAKHPGARSGPRLDLPTGWEPDWTFAEINRPAQAPVSRESRP